ncbi:MAG: response regulator [Cyclobacteriaceae bacterium]
MMRKEKYCLLVEDDPDDQDLFIDALHDVSSTTGCYAVSNGQEALYTLLQTDFNPDYIFTDLNMPKMDGFEFLRILRSMERLRNIPVIVYSSDYSEEQIQKVRTLGVMAYYSKTRIGVLKDILKKYFHDPISKNTVL